MRRGPCASLCVALLSGLVLASGWVLVGTPSLASASEQPTCPPLTMCVTRTATTTVTATTTATTTATATATAVETVTATPTATETVYTHTETISCTVEEPCVTATVEPQFLTWAVAGALVLVLLAALVASQLRRPA